MSVYAIEIRTEFGRDAQSGINSLIETSGSHTAYAHSKEQATRWVMGTGVLPQPELINDGHTTYVTAWFAVEHDLLMPIYAPAEATHRRESYTIYAVNTVFDAVGFGSPEDDVTKLVYEVTMITEYDNEDEAKEAEPRYFARRENAVAHAEHYTNVKESNGVFDSGWRDDPTQVFFADDFESPRLRIVARINTVTVNEIEECLDK